MNAFEAAEKNGKVEERYEQLFELAKAQNRTTDGSSSVTAALLRVTVSL